MGKRNTFEEIEYRIGENVAEGLRKRLNFTVVAKGRESGRKVEVKKVGRGIEIIDEAILEEGFGDPLGEAGRQLIQSLEDKIAGDKVLEYEVIVETERDSQKRKTLVYVEVEYKILEEDKETLTQKLREEWELKVELRNIKEKLEDIEETLEGKIYTIRRYYE